MSDLRETLLEAHVQHELSRLQSDALPEQLDVWTRALFEWFEQIKLDDIATPAQVMGVIDRYVIEMRMSGGITELAGEMSHIVFTSDTSAATRLDEVLDDAAYESFAEKVSSLEGLRRELISLVVHSEAFRLVSARLMSRTLSDMLLGLATTAKLSGRLLPALERRVAQSLARLFERQQARTAVRSEQRLLELVDPDCVRSVADEVWTAISPLRLAEVFVFISESDLEDFVALGYEFWLRYRKSSYFRRITEEVLAHFFDKYGQQSVSSLIEDMGVDEQMVAHELKVFLGPLLAEAGRTGFLEQQIRAQLEPFYRSQALSEILARA